jgi:uridylate kinase
MNYKRVLLKLSGEALSGKEPHGISQEACLQIAHGIKELVDAGIQVGIVIGGGNIFRGLQGSSLGINRVKADQMGMLATIINGLAFSEVLQTINVKSVVMSALDCKAVVEPFNQKKAIEALEQNKVVIFVGGTSNPFFTTDTAAALRASEIQAEIVLKATKVDGIYSKDPIKHKDALRFETLTYSEVLAQKLDVMDATSIALCMSNKIPVLVFSMQQQKPLDVLKNPKLGTLVI